MKKNKLFSGIMALTIAISSPAYASDISISVDNAQEISNDKSEAGTESSEVMEASEVLDTESTAAVESEEDNVFVPDVTEMPEDASEGVENTEAAAGGEAENANMAAGDDAETDSEIETIDDTESESDTEATEEIAATENTETAGATGTATETETETAAGDDKFSSDNTDLIYIGSEAELLAMADNPVADYELTADITITDDLTDYIVEYYEGCFNGNGHTITYKSSNSKCLFRTLTSTATVKNLNVYAEITDDMNSAAMITISSYGKVINCTSSGSITTNSVASGIVLDNSGLISNCTNNARISGGIKGAASGITSASSGIIKGCINKGNIDGDCAGGIAFSNSVETTSCINYGTVKGVRSSGGIICTSSSDVINCTNYGQILSYDTSAYVGGITGDSSDFSSIKDCMNYGEINGTGCIGGICGTAKITSGSSFDENDILIIDAGNIVISNCENHGKVTGAASANQHTNIGGIVGTADTLNGPISISSCTNYETVIGVVLNGSNGNTSAGGIAGGIGCDDRGNGSGSVSLSNLTNYGDVKATYAAGIVRYFTGSKSHPITVKNAINAGNIEGKQAHGIAGSFSNENRIEQCFNAGNVYGYETAYGIGRAYAVTNCYNLGSIKADTGNASGIGWGNISYCYNAGAVVCQKAGSIAVLKDVNESLSESSAESCYYLQAGLNEAFGTGLTASEMQVQSKFGGFDFNNVWVMRQQHGMLLPALAATDTSFMDSLKYLENSNVSLSASSFTYSGTAIMPSVIVTYGQTALANGTDYMVVYRNNVDVGTATAVIVGQGNYSGTKVMTYTIGALPISNASISAIPDQTYSGQDITPEVTLTHNSATLVNGTDYTVSYSNNKNAGTATAVITGIGNYSGSTRREFKITPLSIYSVLTSYPLEQSYTGKNIKPAITVTYNDLVLMEGSDYTVSYSDNKEIGTAKITLTGIGNFCDSRFFYFEITECNIKNATIGKIADQFCTGKAVKPSVSVKLGSTKLKKDQDYTVKYSNNKKAGTATVTISGIANYTGTAKTTFKIVNKVNNVKAASASYNSIKLSWDKLNNATGYKIYRAEKKDGSYECIKTISDKNTTTYTDKKLTCGKKYYYKVAPYKSSTVGKKSGAVSAKPSLAKPKSLAATAKGSKTVNVSWKKVSGASGYEIYRADSKKGTYKKVATIKKGSTVSYKNKKLKKGTTYYYKVRAYRTVGKKKVYSSYSSVVSAKAK